MTAGAACLAAALFAALGAPQRAEGPPACPVDGVSGLGAPAAAWVDAAAALPAESSAACRAKAELVLRAFSPPGDATCAFGPGEAAGLDADGAALAAAIDWRCGRPRAAHEAARAALAADEGATLAWRVLGQLLAARFRPAAARLAFERAVALDEDEAASLWGLAGVAPSRERRRELLGRYLRAAGTRGEPEVRRRAAEQSLAFLEALGEREVWTLERAEVPGTIGMTPLVTRPGSIEGYVARLSDGGRRHFPALVDTGASGLHLSPRLGRKLRVEPLADAVLFGGGGDGEHAVSRGVVKTLDLGPLVFRDAVGVVAPRSLHPRGAYQAILGHDVLSGLVVKVDPGEGALSLAKAERPEPAADPLAVDPFDVGEGFVPLVRVEGQLLVPFRLDTQGAAERRGLALLDTGASRSLVGLDAAAGRPELRLGGGRSGRGYGGSIEFVGSLAHADVSLGAFQRRLRGVPVVDLGRRWELTGVRVDALLGWDLFGRDALVLDLGRGRARIAPAGR